MQAKSVNVVGATGQQMAALRTLFADLKALRLHYRLREGAVSGHLNIYFSTVTVSDGQPVAPDGERWLGYYYFEKREIYLHPSLQSRMVYLTALHELGHYWGLSHRKQGVMIAHGKEINSPLKLRDRRRWLNEVSRLLTAKQLKELK